MVQTNFLKLIISKLANEFYLFIYLFIFQIVDWKIIFRRTSCVADLCHIILSLKIIEKNWFLCAEKNKEKKNRKIKVNKSFVGEFVVLKFIF